MFLFTAVFCVYAQIQIHIDSLELRQISVTLPNNFSTTVFGSCLDIGPDATFYISITNKTDTFVSMNYNEWSFGYFYFYQEKTYNSKFSSGLNLYCIADNEPFVRVLLIPEEMFPFTLRESFLLDYDVRKNKKEEDYDYAKEMLEIIPTIRVYAISPCGKIFFSNQPKHIVIKKKESTEKGYKDILNIKRFLKKLSLFEIP